MVTVLLADDDRAIRNSLARALDMDGYDVRTAADGGQALAFGRQTEIDVIVLDVLMPGLDGIGVCELLRAEGIRTPILMLTARVEVRDRVAGLDAGADDYLAKPFDLDELLARLRALVRRSTLALDADPRGDPTSGEAPAGSEELRHQDLRMDPLQRRAWWTDRELTLSKTEFDLLELLLRNPGRVLAHATIYQRIWGYDFGPDSNNLAVYIGYLRRKLDQAGATDLIRTVRGVGYSLADG
jgi:two-component system, OmpR family, response regulator MprA